jgi:peptidoglycan/LPS O-acetylase OafA/YrhL
MGYVPELDGIRAIAVLLVITAHMHTRFWDLTGGWLGVYIFFVLSGYLITALSLREESDTGALSIPGFYLRRIFRIFPLYYLVLAIYCVLIFGFGVSPEKRPLMSANMPYYLLYFQEVPFFRGRLSTFGQSWSLGIEEKFYLLWPLVGFLILRQKHDLRLWITCGLALIPPLLGKAITPYASILVGCALALALEKVRVRKAITSAGHAGAWICLAMLLAVHFFVMPRWGGTNFSKVIYSVAVASCLAFVLQVRTPINSMLRTSPLVFIGKVSYGIYLVHLLVLNVAEPVVHGRIIPALLLATILSIAVAYVLHVLIEKPMIRVGRRLASQYTHRPAPARA